MMLLAVLISGCVARVYVPPPAVAVQPVPPPVVVQPAPPPEPAPGPAPVAVQPAPPPAVVATPPPVAAVTYVPEYYVWDGFEYVGVCGGQYVYWGGGAWLACDPLILGRFHGWERYHAGWRRGAIRYHGRR